MIRRDPVLTYLFAGIIIFAVLLLLVEKWFPNDGQIFQVMAGLVTGFSGGFFTRIKGAGSQDDKSDPPQTKTTP